VIPATARIAPPSSTRVRSVASPNRVTPIARHRNSTGFITMNAIVQDIVFFAHELVA